VLTGKAEGRKTPIGYLPNSSDLDLRGFECGPGKHQRITPVDAEAWKLEIPRWRNFSRQFGEKTAAPRLSNQFLAELRKRLG